VNYQLVAIRTLDDCHVTARRFKGLGGERHLSIFQMLDRFVEVFYFKCGRSALIGRRPLFADIRDCQGIITDCVLDPLSVPSFVENC
jgi:hypothetical protein